MTRSRDRRRCAETAEVLIGLWTVTWLDEFAACRRRIFIDTDPGFTQFGMSPDVGRRPGFASPIDFHEHYTYGARIGQPDCPIPTHGIALAAAASAGGAGPAAGAVRAGRRRASPR